MSTQDWKGGSCVLLFYCIRNIFLAAISFSLASAQTLHTISGIVLDASANVPLPAATIRVAGESNQGTITNERGRFQLPLPAGEFTLIVSYLGYRSDTIHTSSPNTGDLRALLQPEAIKMAEVVVTDEDPAIEIIRRAIESKPKWMGALKTFQAEAYSRNTISMDTSIAAVIESYETLYWRANDSLREVIRQKRQTKNLPIGDLVNSVGQVTNFNDDTIRTGGFKLIGPTSPNALSYYDYKLLKTRMMDGLEVYDIEVIPKTRLRPLFRGTISISERSYSVMGVDFEPNEAYAIPFVKNVKFHYHQQFRLYEKRFWMPVDYRVEGRFQVSLAGIALLKFSFNRYVVMSDYIINPGFADTVAKLPRLTIAQTAEKFDSTYWVQHVILPLNADEEDAYQRLDSNATLEKQFGQRTRGLNAFGTGLAVLSYADIRFNRVEGLFLGGKIALDSVSNSLAVREGIGYGFSDHRWKFTSGATFYFDVQRMFGIGADVYRKLDNVPDENYYPDIEILFGTLLAKDDYRNYFLSRGWHGFVEGNFLPDFGSPALTMQFGFEDEKQTSLTKITEFSFFDRDRTYRNNPPILDGTLRALTINAEYGSTLLYFFRNPYVVAHTSVEYSSKDVLGSDFDFTRFVGSVKAKFPSYNLGMLFNPTLSISLSGGIITGTPVPQRIFNLESSYTGSAWFGALRTARVKEFSGDRFVSFSVEHNFRRVPFLASGIPFLYNSNLEFIAFGSLARSWLSSSTRKNLPPYAATTNGWFYEMGAGISRIFDLFRFDATWRGVAPRSLVLTLDVADIF